MSLIVIQRGHVPRTSGATGAPGEQQFAREAAERCKFHINSVGHSVRVIDADVPDEYYRGDAFFALHWDSSTDPNATGASVGYQNPEGGNAARLWKAHYERNGWTRGFRPDNYTANLGGYYGVRAARRVGNVRAIITEAGFQSNPGDKELLNSPGGPDRIGISIAATVVDLLGVGGGMPCPPAQGLPQYPGEISMAAKSTGHPVSVWQTEFNNHYLGWHNPNSLVVDGICGSATNHVIWSFQAARGLVQDGVAGPATWHSLILG